MTAQPFPKSSGARAHGRALLSTSAATGQALSVQELMLALDVDRETATGILDDWERECRDLRAQWERYGASHPHFVDVPPARAENACARQWMIRWAWARTEDFRVYGRRFFFRDPAIARAFRSEFCGDG